MLSLFPELKELGNFNVVSYPDTFNASQACNLGASHAVGDLLLFLDDDLEVVAPEWLRELVGFSLRPGVGVVGPMLIAANGTIEHAGGVIGIDLDGDLFKGASPHDWGVFGSADVPRNCLAVTAACQLIRRKTFDLAGGFDEDYRAERSAVQLCLRVWRAGYRVAYAPSARLRRSENTSPRPIPPEERALVAADIRALGFHDDPYFHPGLSATIEQPTLRLGSDPGTEARLRNDTDRILGPYRHSSLDLFDDQEVRDAVGLAWEECFWKRSRPRRSAMFGRRRASLSISCGGEWTFAGAFRARSPMPMLGASLPGSRPKASTYSACPAPLRPSSRNCREAVSTNGCDRPCCPGPTFCKARRSD